MKKMLWMAALTSVAFVGCVSEDVAENNQTQQRRELMFGAPMMYNQSRSVDGEILGTKYPDGENFVVFAVETEGNFKGWDADNVQPNKDDQNIKSFFPVNGVIAAKSGDYWRITGDEKYYWPDEINSNHKLTFAAYSPARASQNGIVSYEAGGLKIVDFTMKENPSQQYDLMYSTRTVDATSSPVTINFKHALSSIVFKFVKPSVQNGGANSITIKKVSVSGGIFDIGTFKQDIAQNSPSSSGTPIWVDKKHINDNDINKNIEYVLFSGEFSVPDSEGTVINNASSFLPIPQNVTDDMVVNITYKTQQEAGDEFSEDITETIPFKKFLISNTTNYTQEWQLGCRYIYHVHFGALKEIFFNPVIAEDWQEITEAGVYTIGTSNNGGKGDGDNDGDGNGEGGNS